LPPGGENCPSRRQFWIAKEGSSTLGSGLLSFGAGSSEIINGIWTTFTGFKRIKARWDTLKIKSPFDDL